jgi:hypothetical protein
LKDGGREGIRTPGLLIANEESLKVCRKPNLPHLRIGHIVAIDRFGVIDPQEHPALYRSLDDFVSIFKVEGWRLYSAHFWLVQ